MYDPTKPYTVRIQELIRSTWETPYVSVRDGGIVREKFTYPDRYPHADGIGTKGVYHWAKRTFRNAVIDALAMNLNDSALMRSTPYEAVVHLELPSDDHEAIGEITACLVEECRKRNIAIPGGETAIKDTVKGLEIGITMRGFIRRPKPNQFLAGDVLVGLGSTGVHSNGFTKIREVFRDEFRPEFVAPTAIYSDAIAALNEVMDIHGMAHITGGAFTKLCPLLHGNDAMIHSRHSLDPQPIFWELRRSGVQDAEMYRIFNCGIGFIVGVAPDDVARCLDFLRPQCAADVIGQILPGEGRVVIESKFMPAFESKFVPGLKGAPLRVIYSQPLSV